MVEAEFVFELLVLLLDRPSLMRDPDESRQRGRGRQMNEEILGDFGAADRALEQPLCGLAQQRRARDAVHRKRRAPGPVPGIQPRHLLMSCGANTVVAWLDVPPALSVAVMVIV